jgi:hypothetical protein
MRASRPDAQRCLPLRLAGRLRRPVGRTAADNDVLTFKIGAPRDFGCTSLPTRARRRLRNPTASRACRATPFNSPPAWPPVT